MKLDINQIQIIALSSIDEPDWKAQYRAICRWYSREFSTPLMTVENDLSILHVLLHYYETTFAKLSASEDEQSQTNYEILKERILYGPKTEAELQEEQAEEDDWVKQMNQEIEQNRQEIEQNQAVEVQKVKDAESLKNPNIEDSLEFSVQGEEGPPS